MGQIIKVQRPVSSAPISGLYVILETTFTIALLGVLLDNNKMENIRYDTVVSPLLQNLIEISESK